MKFLAFLGVIANLILSMWALAKGFHIEGTSEAIDRADVGQRMAIASVPGIIAGVVALFSTRFLVTATVLTIALAVVAAVMSQT